MNTIQKQWQSYEAAVVPKDASRVQRREMRRAFYAGAQGLMAINFAASDSHISETAGAKILQGCQSELNAFVRDIRSGRA